MSFVLSWIDFWLLNIFQNQLLVKEFWDAGESFEHFLNWIPIFGKDSILQA
jgi:hypothetical protein